MRSDFITVGYLSLSVILPKHSRESVKPINHYAECIQIVSYYDVSLHMSNDSPRPEIKSPAHRKIQ
jgi:hypothetical protein